MGPHRPPRPAGAAAHAAARATPSYLAFLGRISPEKAVDHAIRIAQRCGVPLKIAAKVDKVDRDYFEDEIRPLLDSPDVEYIGEIGDSREIGVPQRRRRAAGADRTGPSRSAWS